MTNKQTKISFAPFQGLTDKYFRKLFMENFGGVDLFYAPFVSGCGTAKINKSKLSDLLINDKPLPKTIPQIISKDSREILLFGKTLTDYGYKHINWNLGCPFGRIANKMKGSGLLPYPERLKIILDEIFSNKPPFTLSIKTRLGYFTKEEIFDAVEVFNQYPIIEVIIHPRIGKQLYQGATHLNEFEKCIKLSDHPVAYNGDIYNKPAFREKVRMFNNIKHFMIGRGLLINPFLGEQINNIVVSENERRERLWSFVKQLCKDTHDRIINERKTTGHLKAITYYLAGSFKDAEKGFSKIKKTITIEQFLKAFNELLKLPLSNDEDFRSYFISGIRHV